MFRFQPRTLVLCGGLALAVLIAYANHFQNDFHFDDFHTVTNNPYIRDLHYIPRFFVDPMLFSTLADHATWRPIVSASLAIDYRMGRGRVVDGQETLSRFPFHFSTFVWYIVQLILMFFLFRRIMDAASPHPSNLWTAFLATACYGLHPANAETVNYIVQRGDLYNTLGVVASLLWFIAYPAQRKHGWYLLPTVAAYLSKAPALIYPFILLAYVWLFESPGFDSPGSDSQGRDGRQPGVRRFLVRATLPAFLVTAAAALLTLKMTPAAYNPGASSGSLYRITQPWVALHYFKVFFLPTGLSADTDWGFVLPFSAQAIAGYLFVIGLLAVAFYTARRPETRPIAFGLFWFFLALLPTSLMPLAEVTNDHRMFFPFVGLALAVFWALRLLLFRETARLTLHRSWLRGAIVCLAVVMIAEAAGTHQRNIVWRTDASLWHDVTIKSPKNGRGMMNYGITFVPRDYQTALRYLLLSDRLLPNYLYCHLNLGIVYSGLGRDRDAEEHYQRAVALGPDAAEPHIFYASWLKGRQRLQEAQEQLETAVRISPRSVNARHILIQLYYQEHKQEALDRMVQDTLQIDSRDGVALRFRNLPKDAGRELSADAFSPEGLGGLPPGLLSLAGKKGNAPTPVSSTTASRTMGPQALLNTSAGFCKVGKYEECLAAAKQATEMDPTFAAAFNNLAAAYLAMQRWDEGILAAQQALQIQPDYQQAMDNLQYGQIHKRQIEAEIQKLEAQTKQQ
jgi:tetratricopeptide (TPR) repeat protein/FtsH-binding integral membrane protein